MLVLRDLIGEEKLNRVLRKLVDDYGHRDEFTLQSSAFLAELCRVTWEHYHSLIGDWFKRIITYDLSIKGATYRKLGHGQFVVSMAIDASRKQILESGQELAVSIDEPISVGIFMQHPAQISNDQEIIYLQPHRITDNDTIITIVVSELPAYVAVDPFGTRNDENLINNISKLTEEE